MLNKLLIRNFKRFGEVEIDLGNPVVFIGPNNSGKTTALQALALWDIGLKRWIEKRQGKTTPEQRPGVTINRRDLIAVPVPSANLLWRDLHVRDIRRVQNKQRTQNIRIEIIVEGVTSSQAWKCGLEFDYANAESFYCRPLRLTEAEKPERMVIPDLVNSTRVAFLPPMSGLADQEFLKQPGEISFLIGQGRTAEVLRNLCYRLIQNGDRNAWGKVCSRIEGLFGVQLDEPQYIPERSEIELTYRDRSGVSLDISSSGRGLQQTLLLLTYLAANPNSVLLLDEPDAHLEILRQRQTYQLLTEAAREQDSQIIAASHSEIILNEAADRDVVVAFLGKPHRIDDRGFQLLKSLKEIGFDQYYQAEQNGWVLYLEGPTDLAILSDFAEKLNHPAQEILARPFVRYVLNQPTKARDHFRGLREAKPDLVGIAIFDRIDSQLQNQPELLEYKWKRREIENYLCQAEVLLAWARQEGDTQIGGPLFAAEWVNTMAESVDEIEKAMNTLSKGSPWSSDTKVSDDFLDPLFAAFFRKLRLPNLMRKTDYHILTKFVPLDRIDSEIGQVLDMIVTISKQAKPAQLDI